MLLSLVTRDNACIDISVQAWVPAINSFGHRLDIGLLALMSAKGMNTYKCMHTHKKNTQIHIEHELNVTYKKREKVRSEDQEQ